MSTPPQTPESDPELESLQADESVPPRPEEDVADAGADLYRHNQPGQSYPPSPQPQEVDVDAPSTPMADPDYQPPDYPNQVSGTS